MNEKLFFQISIYLSMILFLFIFLWIVLPAFFAQPDIVQAFMGGFVNPFAMGYSTDTIACFLILSIWIIYESKMYNIRHGWICILLSIVPGVAVGFGLYLLMRVKQTNG